MTYRQAIERANLSIECDTPAVPNDGYFYVLHLGREVGRYKSLKQAQRKYGEILSGLNLAPLEISAEERASAQARSRANAIVAADRVETFAASTLKKAKRGGKSRTYR